MANVMNTYSAVADQNQLTATNAEFYHKTLLERLKGELMITKYATKGLGAPKHAGDTISYRKYGALTVNTTALTEGVTPDCLTASVSKITSQVKQYGDWLLTSDKLQVVGLDPIITELTEVLGQQAGEKIETLAWNALVAGTNVLYAGANTARNTIATTDKLTSAKLLKMASMMKVNKVKPISLPDGSNGYILFAHPKQCYDLKQDSTWLDANKYVDNKGLINGVIGKLYGIYVVEYDFATELTDAGAGGTVEVYQAVCLGKNAFAMPDIDGSAKPEFIVKVPNGNNDNTSDPLNQRSTIGYKCLLDVKVIEPLAVIRFESGSSY